MSMPLTTPVGITAVDKSVDPRFLKTRICSFNLRGKCTRGQACKFAHDFDEMATLPDLRCTRICKSILISGMCSDGDACSFAHSREELRQNEEAYAPKTLMPKLRKVDMCKFFVRGRCIGGKTCNFAHDENELQDRPNLHRTKRCFAFLKGKCTAGDECKYAHRIDNLQTGSIVGDDQLAIPLLTSPEGILFSRQSSIGTSASLDTSASQDSGDGAWSRQSSSTSWTGFDEDDVQNFWSRQGTLDTILDPAISSPTQDSDASADLFTRQYSWADLDDESDVVACLWSGQASLDLTSSTGANADTQRASTPTLDSDDSIGACSAPGANSDSEVDVFECPESQQDNFGIVETAGALSHQHVYPRLQMLADSHRLKITVKNTFLDFEDCRHDVFCGSAARRVRSAA